MVCVLTTEGDRLFQGGIVWEVGGGGGGGEKSSSEHHSMSGICNIEQVI